jgi:hypothetical protein
VIVKGNIVRGCIVGSVEVVCVSRKFGGQGVNLLDPRLDAEALPTGAHFILGAVDGLCDLLVGETQLLCIQNDFLLEAKQAANLLELESAVDNVLELVQEPFVDLGQLMDLVDGVPLDVHGMAHGQPSTVGRVLEFLADEIYYLPVTPEYAEYVIQKEKPDGIFLSFGGQTALNLGVQMNKKGIFEKYGVKVLGTSVKTLETSEDRDLFARALDEIGTPIAKSIAVSSIDEALAAAEDVGYPIIVRAAYALGGLGSGFANNADELRDLSARSLTLSPQILVEKSLKGWKEAEYEVVRDASDNCITVCNMENFDPLGVHTGDSIVVSPSQTFSDEEYHMLRSEAIKIVRQIQRWHRRRR